MVGGLLYGSLFALIAWVLGTLFKSDHWGFSVVATLPFRFALAGTVAVALATAWMRPFKQEATIVDVEFRSSATDRSKEAHSNSRTSPMDSVHPLHINERLQLRRAIFPEWRDTANNTLNQHL
jgi:hypothetical protein